MQTINKQFKINSLYYWALKLSSEINEEKELMNRDVTDLFFNELELVPKTGELLNITINGNVRKGKSTIGIYLAWWLFENVLRPLYGYPDSKQFGMQNIARDQQEFSLMMRNDDLSKNVIVTDEFNVMEKGGENSTVEQNMLVNFSNVHAERYVHKFSIAPKYDIDANSDVYLEVQHADKESYTTHCHLYYNLYKGGVDVKQLIGYVNICVEDLISNWVKKVLPVYYNENITPKDKKKVLSWAKKDFYVEYMIKKREKMQLITKEGVLVPRKLDYAPIVLEAFNNVKDLCEVLTKGQIREVVGNEVVDLYNKNKLGLSMLGKKEATDQICGLCSLYATRFELNKALNDLNNALLKGKMSKDLYLKNKVRIEDNLVKFKERLAQQLATQERYKKINELYHSRLN